MPARPGHRLAERDHRGHEEYLLSAVFSLLFAALADPGGGFGRRASRIGVFGLVGAGLTALGSGIGADAWGWLVLAAFAVTLVAGLTAAFVVHRFVGALLLDMWLVVALGLAPAFITTLMSPATPGRRWSLGPAALRSGSRSRSSGG